MKNSAWYSKLWRNKLDKLPVKSNAGAAWTNMQQMLDAHLPIGGIAPAAPVAGKTLIAKIVIMAGYILPAAAMVGAATWFAVKPPAKQKVTLKQGKKHEYRLKANNTNKEDVFNADSSKTQAYGSVDTLTSNADSLYNNTGVIKNDSSLIAANKGLTTNGPEEKKLPAGNKEALVAGGAAGASATQKGAGVMAGASSGIVSKLVSKENRPGNNSSTTARRANGGGHSMSTNGYAKSLNNKSNGRHNHNGYASRNGSQVKPNKSAWGIANKTRANNQTASRSKVEIPKELSSYTGTVFNLNTLQDEESTFSVLTNSTSGNSLSGNNSLLLADEKPDAANAGNVNQPVSSKAAATKPVKNSLPKEIITPAYNLGLEGGLSISNGTGFYGGLTADYAITNRILIGAGLRLNTARKLTGSYSHPSYYRPDSSARFNINEERKISVVDVPLNLTYKVNNFISLKAGAIISFAGRGNATYTLGPVGGFRDTLRRRSSIDSTVNISALAKKGSLGFTGGVSFNIKQFSIDARYLVLPPYKVNNSLGSYSQSYNPFQIGITYWLKQGAKKSPLVK